MTDSSHLARCEARQKELFKADNLIMAAMATLVHVESDHVFLALRQARREVSLALNNVAYDAARPPKEVS